MTVQSFITNHASDNTYNGWANYETWNVALWIQNVPFLYNTAKACVEYCGDDETPYEKFIRCMTNCDQPATRDGVAYDDPSIDHAEILDMMTDL
jgi:hypothetical protein